MYPPRGVREPRDPRRTDFVSMGFAAVISAVSFLLPSTVGGDEAVVPGSNQWQVILAFALLAAGLLSIMRGMRLRNARPPAFVRRVVDAAAVVLWNAGGPERLLPLVILLLYPFLEAWFDFI